MTFNRRLAALATLYAVWPGIVLGGTLAEVPLGLRGAVPSNVLFDISVEWPTAITAAYPGASNYKQATQYEGLFDPGLCYEYDTANLYFVPKNATADHGCTGQWSGNFLNWATMTGLDEFRYATTGGNRAIDLPDLTVLERTYITNNGSAAGFFPQKVVDTTTTEFQKATEFSNTANVTIDNWSKGSTMVVSGTKTQSADTVTCTTPQNGSPYCSSIKLSSDGTSGTCLTWAGNGNTGNAFRCTKFGTFSGGSTTISAINSCTSTAKNTNVKDVCVGYSVSTSKTINTTYKVRVKACDKALPLRDNCQQYSNGFYKPVGEIQRNGEKMRFGVFAYYNANDIDNAVMRARLKYVAPNKYSSAAATIDNPNKEWDENGVLIKNPDADAATGTKSYAKDAANNTVPNSGVINYLNKFGSNTQSYKSFDNISKIYYESLRYLRKLPPTADFYQNATTANDDDFPIISDWYKGGTDDPIQYYCQKNYIITMGDQFTHCDKRLPGGSLTPFGADQCSKSTVGNNADYDQNSLANGDTAVDVTQLTNVIGSYEDVGQLGKIRTGAGDNASFYMAGLAHWAATNDIRPPGPTDLKNPIVEVNDNGEAKKVEMPQTVKTFVIDVEENQTLAADRGRTDPNGSPLVEPYRSLFWYTAKYGGGGGEFGYYAQDSNGKVIPGGNVNLLSKQWSKGIVDYTTPRIYKNSVTGATYPETYKGDWPKTLLRAGDPVSMIASIKEALATVDAETGTSSALAQSSGDLRTGNDAYVYRATFDSSVWSGELQEFKISADLATIGKIDGTPVWSASEKIPAWDKRLIFTYNNGVKANNIDVVLSDKRPVAFDASKFTENLSERQRYLLNRNGNNIEDGRGALRMAYLRGDESNEGKTFTDKDPKESWRSRVRTLPDKTKKHFVLGDMINSNPVYVGPPIPDMPGKGYNIFAQKVKARTPMIYVGANDGMLHGFDATNGTERLAYIPSAVYPKLSQLTSNTYNHKYFVDGTPTVSEACKGLCGGDSDWFTLLVGGLNAGGQGLYALDVTNPSDFTAGNVANVVRWEFTDHDDKDLGYTFSKPIIRLMNDGKWAVIVGNGFNNSVSDDNVSSTGRAYLYILYVDGPGGGPWNEGTHYRKIELRSPDDTAGIQNPANGLASVAGVDRDLDGTVDYIYAGDRRGNLWKVNVSSTNPSEWKSAFGSLSAPEPLFTAKHTSGSTTTPQSITTGVEVSPHPNGGYMVLFGTGSFVESTDSLAPFNTDSFYGIWDKDDATADNQGTKVTGDNAARLQKQKIIATVQASIGGNKVEYLFQSACEPNYNDVVTTASNQKGDVCPSDIASGVGTKQQFGWVFNLPQAGERVASDAPLIQSGIATVTSVQPSDDPCAGNTTGREYNLNYLTGGAAGSGIFDLNQDGKIDANDLINLSTGATGDDTGLAASGRKFDGGASDTPLRFLLKRPPADTSGSGSSTYACKDFIPGWGCPSELAPQRNCQRWVEDVVSDELLKAGAVGLGGTKKCLPGKAGRLTWRQIVK